MPEDESRQGPIFGNTQDEIELWLKMKNGELNTDDSSEINFIGIDGTDLETLPDLLIEVFGEQLLSKLLISNIEFYPETVFYYLNTHEGKLLVRSNFDYYNAILQQDPSVRDSRYRAISLINYNLDRGKKGIVKYYPTPIKVYSFKGMEGELEELEYLEGVEAEKRMRIYKQGTVVHEVAHHLYAYLLSEDQLLEWENLVNGSPEKPITQYAHEYNEKDPILRLSEWFSEAMRLYATVPDYLHKNFSEIYFFLHGMLSQFKANN